MKLTRLTSALAALACFVLVGAPVTAEAKTPKSATVATGSFSLSLLKQLDLSKAEKKEVKQIKKSTSDKKQECQKVVAVLTPTQKAKLQQLIASAGIPLGKHKPASA